VGAVILVTGGTGMVGREVVRRLLADEHEVRVLSRRGRPLGQERLPVRWFRGDLRDGRGLAAALPGCDAVVHCATTGRRADVTLTRNLVDAARRGGDPHLVYVSVVGVDRVPGVPFYRAKLACERIVALSGLPWTVLRATQCEGSVRRLVRAQRALPVVVTLGGGVPLRPLPEALLGERLAELAVAGPAGRVPDLAGPAVRTVEELTRAALDEAGGRRPVLPVRLPGRAYRAARDGALLTTEADARRSAFAANGAYGQGV
jgi:uncharacterized protein YbjT (DUF2867 family)